MWRENKRKLVFLFFLVIAASMIRISRENENSITMFIVFLHNPSNNFIATNNIVIDTKTRSAFITT
jgi:hypothetical protein